MITRVLGSQGQVLHDCRDAGCTVSWDGYALVDNLLVEDVGGALATAQPAPEGSVMQGTAAPAPTSTTVNRGDALPGALAPDPSRWTVSAPDANGEQVATRVADPQ